mmetsp:Transcript_151133/g.267669  ORF Transcript_151133/g.267669 Transcript_151133/m.267669 type:complete len:503 (-) Transcript_151133:71-1579(-)
MAGSGVLRAPSCRTPGAGGGSAAGAPPPRAGHVGLGLRATGSHCAAPCGTPVAGPTAASSPKVAPLGRLAAPEPGPPAPQSSRSSNGSTSSEPGPSRGHRFVRRVATPTPAAKAKGSAAGLQDVSTTPSTTPIAGCGRAMGPPPSRGVNGSLVPPYVLETPPEPFAVKRGALIRAASNPRCMSPQEGEPAPWHWTPRTAAQLLPPYTQPGPCTTEVTAASLASTGVTCSTPTAAGNSVSSTASTSSLTRVCSYIPPLPAFSPEAAHPLVLAPANYASADRRTSVSEEAWQELAMSAKRLEEQKAELYHLVQNLRGAHASARAEEPRFTARRASQAQNEKGHISATPAASDSDVASGSSGPPKSHGSARRIHAALHQALSENNVRPGEPDVAGHIQRVAALRRTKELFLGSADPRKAAASSTAAPLPSRNEDGSKNSDDYLELAGLIWQLVGGDRDTLTPRRGRGAPTPPPPLPLPVSDPHCVGTAEPEKDGLSQFRGPFGGG